MSFSKRLRNIARAQLEALKERLDRVDSDPELELKDLRAEYEARRELESSLQDASPSLRSPEEIARGSGASASLPPSTQRTSSAAPASSLARAYRVLGLAEGAELADVEAAYAALVARCAPERFEEGSEEQRTAREILRRVEEAYDELRGALDPTAGRFDKLEL